MPQRFLRPGITDSDRFNSVSFGAQTLWVRLLTVVDDYGRFDGRCSVLCGRCFSVWNDNNPANQITAADVGKLCDELSKVGLVDIYYVEGKPFLQMLNWREKPRASTSSWPGKPEMCAPCVQADNKCLQDDNNPLRNPAESCLPRSSPSPSFLDHTPSPSPAPSVGIESAVGVERPGLQEVLLHADRIGLAPWKAEDWFHEMEGGGWLDFNHRPVANWRSVLTRVRTKWEADGRPSAPPSKNGSNGISPSVQAMLHQKELDRVEGEVTRIKNQYDGHQDYTDKHKKRLGELSKRKAKLKTALGFQV